MNHVVRRIANNVSHTSLYNRFFRNTTTQLATVLVVAFFAEFLVDSATNQMWNVANRGRRWSDVLADRKAKGLTTE